jgi:hypothetical protein
LADLLITRQRFVEKVEQVVMQGQAAFHELGIMRQTHHVIGENLN